MWKSWARKAMLAVGVILIVLGIGKLIFIEELRGERPLTKFERVELRVKIKFSEDLGDKEYLDLLRIEACSISILVSREAVIRRAI